VPAGAGVGGEKRREHAQGIGEDVGDGDVAGAGKRVARVARLEDHVVLHGIVACGFTASGSMSTAVVRPAPSLRAAIARMPEPQP
jgi:dienelactone hydrolase